MSTNLIPVRLISLTFTYLDSKNVGYTRVYEDKNGTSYTFSHHCKNKQGKLRSILEDHEIGDWSSIHITDKGEYIHV